MKFFHLSDLHLGKRVNEFSMMEDQAYILDQVLELVCREKPQAVVIAGDVYDRAVPSAEAVQLLDDFLWNLSRLDTRVLLISGNHDCPERMAFGGRLMEASGIHIAPVYQGKVEQVTLEDEWGPVEFCLLPFVKPVTVRRYFPDRTIQNYTQAMEAALSELGEGAARRVLVTHQYVTGADRTQSEELWLGGSEAVDGTVFEPFSYVALGHIHRPQTMMGGKVRYCGTPLKYSFSEVNDHKSVTVVELGETGKAAVTTLPLTPLREMRRVRGSFEELTAPAALAAPGREDYLGITLTDQEDIPDGMRRLQMIYPNLMALEYDNLRTRTQNQVNAVQQVEEKSPLELFGELYQTQNNKPMSPQQEEYLEELIREIWEEEA